MCFRPDPTDKFAGLDYWRFADVCDRIWWASYPRLHAEDSWKQVADTAPVHDMQRTTKGGLPFILMESSPSATNWMPTARLKKPGQHRQEMLVAIGHGEADHLDAFVKSGGTRVLTYPSGVVNETQLVPSAGKVLGLKGKYPVKDYCERVHPEGAAALATYKNDFCAGMPALTVNKHGAGQVYCLAARPAADGFLDVFTRGLASQLTRARCLDVEPTEGVTVQKRSGGRRTFYFLHNCRRREQAVDLGAARLKDVSASRIMTGSTTLAPFASFVPERI